MKENIVRTIQTRGTVSEDRKLTIDVPPDVTPGEHQVVVVITDLPGTDLAAVAQHGGSFDWLNDEPDLYTDQDGEPVGSSGVTATESLLDDLGLTAQPWRAWPENGTFSRDETDSND